MALKLHMRKDLTTPLEVLIFRNCGIRFHVMKFYIVTSIYCYIAATLHPNIYTN